MRIRHLCTALSIVIFTATTYASSFPKFIHDIEHALKKPAKKSCVETCASPDISCLQNCCNTEWQQSSASQTCVFKTDKDEGITFKHDQCKIKARCADRDGEKKKVKKYFQLKDMRQLHNCDGKLTTDKC